MSAEFFELSSSYSKTSLHKTNQKCASHEIPYWRLLVENLPTYEKEALYYIREDGCKLYNGPGKCAIPGTQNASHKGQRAEETI